jgi:hypothetical protein
MKYRFNPRVFAALVELTHSLWNSERKINRSRMILLLVRYLTNKETDDSKLTNETKQQLFELFIDLAYDRNSRVGRSVLSKTQLGINRAMKQIRLTDEQLNWLLEHFNDSPYFLNRILRYRWKSPVISRWARDNYYNDLLRERRRELTSWILDEDPDFLITEDDIIDDFDYFILEDCERLKQIQKRKELEQILGDHHPDDYRVYMGFMNEEQKVFNKYYGLNHRGILRNDCRGVEVLIVEYTKKAWLLVNTANLYAVSYSRLDKETKSRLIKKLYRPENEWRFFSFCKKLELVDLMEWLLEK